MPETDIQVTAAEWIRNYGEEAPDELRRRAAVLGRAGDMNAAEELRRIAEAAELLLIEDGRKK